MTSASAPVDRCVGAETIFAISSGLPPAAIAIMRISGPMAGQALRRLAGMLPAPRRASLRTLADPRDGRVLDRALILWFPGPATATGEDLVELHLHGGRAVIAAVSAALLTIDGLRAAEPGAFTRRAFLNGRIDLAAAEGLADLLMAETEAQRRAATEAAGGALGREIEQWRRRLLAASARIEAALDFADEDDVDTAPTALTSDVETLRRDVAAALARPSAERLRDGVRVVLAGPPNVGKSTLLNALAERDAAIVSPTAGTTRDRIEVPVAIAGVPLLLTDTAGVHDTEDEIEALGIARARAAFAAADILVWLGDGPAPATCGKTILVYPRIDLPARRVTPAGRLGLSARSGEGVDALRTRITGAARALLPREGEGTVNRRQRRLIGDCVAALSRVPSAPDLVLMAEELRLARRALDAIVGRAGVEDMLDTLFSSFCIGK